MKKKKIISLGSTNIVSIVVCVLAIGVLIYSCVETYNMEKNFSQQKLQIEKYITSIQLENQVDEENELSDVYLNYYNQIDQKATDTINKIISFVAFVFSMITITNTIVAIRLPKNFEDKIKEIDLRIHEIEVAANESKAAAKYISNVHVKETVREKIEEISQVINEYGDTSGELYFERGSFYSDIKEFDNAENDYKSARKAGLSEYIYHNAMGVLYSDIMEKQNESSEKRSAFRRAEKHYKKAIGILEHEEIQRSDFHCNLACLYQEFGKLIKRENDIEESNKYFELAMKQFDLAIEIDDKNKIAYLDRGVSFEELGPENYVNAYNDYLQCIKIDPDYEQGLKYLADIALKLYNKSGDIKYLIQAKHSFNNMYRKMHELTNLQSKINNCEKGLHDELIARIDREIADLQLKQANEYKPSSKEYLEAISEAIKSYRSSLDLYKQIFFKTNNESLVSHIKHIENAINKLEKIIETQNDFQELP